jgi:hypothetical protein
VFIINYLILTVLCAFSELFFVADVAKDVQTMVRTAADMALEQAQATDDFFIKDYGYNTDGANGYTIKMAKNGTFEDVPMYQGLYGINTSIQGNKEVVFNKLYNTSDFKAKAKSFSSIKSSLAYYNTSRNGLLWYKFPKITQVGLDVTGTDASLRTATTASGGSVSSSVSEGIIALYNFNEAKRQGYDYTTGSSVDYFITPISLGITYVNSDLVNQLFLNNMDLLMRAKYQKSGTSLNTEAGGKGILKGSTWVDCITDTSLNSYNPINNGKFTLVRGTTKDNNNGFITYNGIEPKIEYKVIDMYDSANDDILVMLFGANKVADDGKRFSTKAEYLKYLDKDLVDLATGVSPTTKYISVAKITFYADVLIPYQTIPIRDFRGNIDSSTGNYLDITHKGTSGVVGFSGNDCYSYTRYFAVAP